MSREQATRRAIDIHDRETLRDCIVADMLVDVLAPGETQPGVAETNGESRNRTATMSDADWADYLDYTAKPDRFEPG